MSQFDRSPSSELSQKPPFQEFKETLLAGIDTTHLRNGDRLPFYIDGTLKEAFRRYSLFINQEKAGNPQQSPEEITSRFPDYKVDLGRLINGSGQPNEDSLRESAFPSIKIVRLLKECGCIDTELNSGDFPHGKENDTLLSLLQTKGPVDIIQISRIDPNSGQQVTTTEWRFHTTTTGVDMVLGFNGEKPIPGSGLSTGYPLPDTASFRLTSDFFKAEQ